MLGEADDGSYHDNHGEVEIGGDLDGEKRADRPTRGSILQQAVGEGASDVHVEPRAGELTVRFRVDGVLREVMNVPPKFQSGVLARIKILADLDIAERRRPQDGRFPSS
jgi:type IV pilus assembly protein PilB